MQLGSQAALTTLRKYCHLLDPYFSFDLWVPLTLLTHKDRQPWRLDAPISGSRKSRKLRMRTGSHGRHLDWRDR